MKKVVTWKIKREIKWEINLKIKWELQMEIIDNNYVNNRQI